jgi:hypothetical protein
MYFLPNGHEYCNYAAAISILSSFMVDEAQHAVLRVASVILRNMDNFVNLQYWYIAQALLGGSLHEL